jgi:DNA-binding MarR family transcriptional regulator
MTAVKTIDHTLLGELVRTHKSLRQRGDRELGRIGLRVGQDLVLFRLAEGALSQAQLAERLRVEPATASIMVGRLAKAGLVARRSDPSDARVTKIRLTPKGRALETPVLRVWAALEKGLAAGLSAAEVRALKSLLAKVRQNLESRRPNDAE